MKGFNKWKKSFKDQQVWNFTLRSYKLTPMQINMLSLFGFIEIVILIAICYFNLWPQVIISVVYVDLKQKLFGIYNNYHFCQIFIYSTASINYYS